MFSFKTFFGGVHPADGKEYAADKVIETLAEPKIAVIPLQQHIGAPGKPIVQAGDTVAIGQPLSEPGGFVSVPAHASISGTVKKIEPALHPLGMMVPAVVIENDGESRVAKGVGASRAWENIEPSTLLEIISNAGLAGMGGASFPTHVKLSPPKDKEIDTLIINGVECEPYLTADYRLMLERAEDFIIGVKILAKVLHPKKIFIGVEANKPKAVAHLKSLTAQEKISVESLHVKYPQGAEKQLIYSLTKRQVPSGGLPMDAGCVVHNVGTALAVFEAVCMTKPLYERVVTVTGPALNEPKNLLVKIGTPVSELITACGGFKENAVKLISGGPMMGLAQFADSGPVIKGTSGVLVLDDKTTSQEAAQTCISCGQCIEACPMKLLPTSLAKLAGAGRFEELSGYSVMDCIECGCCTYICPAKINITQLIKLGKLETGRIAKQNAESK